MSTRVAILAALAVLTFDGAVLAISPMAFLIGLGVCVWLLLVGLELARRGGLP